jgi:hypothetical protein
MAVMFDGAYARDLAAMKASGAIAVSVYLTGNYAVPKSWVDQVRAAGLGVVPNYEQATNELVTAGMTGGIAVGQRAAAAATALGFPTDASVAIVYSVDVDVPPAQFAQIGLAFDGINSVTHGRFLTEVYAEGALIDYLMTTKRVTGAEWLSASESFPGYNPSSPNVGLVQKIGSPVAGTDLDQITNPTGIHAWWPAGSPFGVTDMDATQDERLKAVYTMLYRMSFGFDTGNAVPWTKRGELTELLRTVDANTKAQPVPASVIAQTIATSIPTFPTVPTADEIGAAAATHVAATNVDAIVAGVLASLPQAPTPEQVAAAVRSNLVTQPLTLH